MKQFFLSIAILISFQQRSLNAKLDVEQEEKNPDMISQVTKFCLDKARENFCSDKHLQMIINFAASQGKARPILNINELEIERQKEMEKKRVLKLEEEKEKKRRIELKKEREKQRQIDLEKKNEEMRMKALEMNKKLQEFYFKHAPEFNRNLLFRFQ